MSRPEDIWRMLVIQRFGWQLRVWMRYDWRIGASLRRLLEQAP